MVQPTSANAAPQKDIPASRAFAPTAASSAPAQTPPASPPEDLYDYRKCTVMIVIQLRPQREEGEPRPVLLSVQNGTGNKEDLPMFRLLSSEEDLGGPLPPAITTLLQTLQQDLPIRKQRNAKSTVTQTNTAQKMGQQKKPAPFAKTTGAAPPVPTTTNPVPKDGLVFGGIFDDL